MFFKDTFCLESIIEPSESNLTISDSLRSSQLIVLYPLCIMENFNEAERYIIFFLESKEICDKLEKVAKKIANAQTCNLKNSIKSNARDYQGRVFIEIIKNVKKFKIAMIVIGSRGSTDLEHLNITKLAQNILDEATCPVYIVNLHREIGK